FGVHLVVFREPALVERRREGCPGTLQGDSGRPGTTGEAAGRRDHGDGEQHTPASRLRVPRLHICLPKQRPGGIQELTLPSPVPRGSVAHARHRDGRFPYAVLPVQHANAVGMLRAGYSCVAASSVEADPSGFSDLWVFAVAQAEPACGWASEVEYLGPGSVPHVKV